MTARLLTNSQQSVGLSATVSTSKSCAPAAMGLPFTRLTVLLAAQAANTVVTGAFAVKVLVRVEKVVD